MTSLLTRVGVCLLLLVAAVHAFSEEDDAAPSLETLEELRRFYGDDGREGGDLPSLPANDDEECRERKAVEITCNKDGRFRNPNFCSQYVVCMGTGTPYARMYVKWCPKMLPIGRLAFDNEWKVCVWPHQFPGDYYSECRCQWTEDEARLMHYYYQYYWKRLTTTAAPPGGEGTDADETI